MSFIPNFRLFQPCTLTVHLGDSRFHQALVLHVPLNHCPETV
jgi:hypothetical protein